MKKVRILLVDDDEGMRLALRRALQVEDYFVIEAANGKQALEQLHLSTVDLVITDIIMPESEGIELTLALRRAYPDLPVIAISGGGNWSSEFHLSLATISGAAMVFEKPFDMHDLLSAVRSLTETLREQPQPPRSPKGRWTD